METYNIKMENFEGPLDLLCHLIDKNKMDICEVKISEITDQYLAYLSEMQKMNLDVTSEFIVMASRLIYLKSKALLPSVIEEDEDEEIDLVQMLIEYKKYKEFTFTLKERMQEYGGKFYKMPDKIELPKGKIEEKFSEDLIPQIYRDFVTKEIEKKNINADNINRLVVAEKITIKSKIKDILKELWKKPTFVFNKIFNLKKNSKVEVVTAFLGLLELSRMSRIEVKQDSLFGDISVTKLKKR